MKSLTNILQKMKDVVKEMIGIKSEEEKLRNDVQVIYDKDQADIIREKIQKMK